MNSITKSNVFDLGFRTSHYLLETSHPSALADHHNPKSMTLELQWNLPVLFQVGLLSVLGDFCHLHSYCCWTSPKGIIEFWMLLGQFFLDFNLFGTDLIILYSENFSFRNVSQILAIIEHTITILWKWNSSQVLVLWVFDKL